MHSSIEPLKLQMGLRGTPSTVHTKICVIRTNHKILSINETTGKYSSNRRRTSLSSKAAGDLLEITERRSANYEPSLWGDFFATFAPPDLEPIMIHSTIEELKKEVSEMLKSSTNIVNMMKLVDTILHLGIGYHFDKEINDALSYLHDTELESNDLQHVALRFRLLRQHGFNASSDVFCKFKDSQGNFDEKLCDDVRGLLSLYNAGYLAFPGETELDEAVSFARSHLISKVNDLNSPLKKQVLRALKRPLHRMVPRVESMFYIEEYEEEETMNDILLKLAKLDYNLVQRLHVEELKDLSMKIYLKVINSINEFQDELQPSEIYRLSFFIEKLKITTKGYVQEVEWQHKKQIPSFNERTKTSIDNYIGTLVVGGPLLGMGEEVTEEIMLWLMTFPDIVMEPMKICRFTDDVTSFEREKNAGQAPTSFGCYMHEHGLTKDEAAANFHSMVEESWKKVNLACVQLANVVPVQILDRMVNFARVSEVEHIDGFNYVSQSKELYGLVLLKQFSL